jgi:hypothetical protein
MRVIDQFDLEAEQEASSLKSSFRSRTPTFGKRKTKRILSKRYCNKPEVVKR